MLKRPTRRASGRRRLPRYQNATQYRLVRHLHAVPPLLFWERRRWILGGGLIIIIILLCRAVYLQVFHKDFLQTQGNARYLRTLPINAHRGMLLDRQGEPLAISTPVDSVWVNPSKFITARAQWGNLATLLDLSATELDRVLATRLQREFVYLKRHISPHLAEKIKTLKLPGLFLQREYRRYYPSGEIFGHVLGFTNIDDQGQEGLELALDKRLAGVAGEKQIIQDKDGQIVANVEGIQMARAGQDIRLTLDKRLQYLAYRELKAAVVALQATAGSAVLLDSLTGDLLAMVNQPAYNPNNWQERQGERYRNRAVTDVFEPGSTLKPFTIATALERGQYTPQTPIDTRPGRLQLGQYTIRDSRNHGIINLTQVIQKSSNVGASKIALSLSPKALWQTLRQAGFGQLSGSGFPGEVTGRLAHFSNWRTVEQASAAFGYGLNVTLLQLARAYAVLGRGGGLPVVHFVSSNQATRLPRVMQPETARQILNMLETVVQPGGTGMRAQVPGFSVAGKTGTVHKPISGGYANDAYFALFVGIVPASMPRLVMAIVLDNPQVRHYGGEAAAPVFSRVMTEALRWLNIPPDNFNTRTLQ